MKDMFSLKDKIAVITGGGSGIGLASSRRFVEAGATVIIACRSDSTEIAESFGASWIGTDVSNPDQVKKLMDETARRHGRIDVVVNNAGWGDVGATIPETSNELLDRTMGINLNGVFYGIKYAVPHMTAGGAIVNVSSLAGMMGMPTYGPYVSSKWAVVGLTKSAALELGPQGIRVNAVCPGTINTPLNEGAEDEYVLAKQASALQRVGEAEEVAALIHFLAADDCGYLTGEAVLVDGGWRTGPSLGLMEKLLS